MHEGMARRPTPLKKSSASESTTTDERGMSHPSSRSTSTDAVMFGSPLTTPSEHRSPVSSAKPSSDQILAFQSDPSLPALLSGASSVSADLEGELLCRPGVVDRNTPLLETTDSLTPPAMGKEPVAGFPLEESLGSSQSVDSGIIPLSVRAQEESDRDEDDDDDDDDDDDAGSDSDEGLTMMSHRRKSCLREPAKGAVGFSKRRDTTASASSNDTARKAPAPGGAM
jgi:[calcium/calmodulin-dependent protein kinase] kinase